VREEAACIEVHRVSADRQHDRDARCAEPLAELAYLPQSVLEVALVENVVETLGDRREVTPGQSAVGGKALDEDEHVREPGGEVVVVHGHEASDVHEPVLLGRHRAAVGQLEEASGNLRDTRVQPAAHLVEVGVLREAAGVEEEGDVVVATPVRHGFGVLETDRLAAAGVVRDREEDERQAVPPHIRQHTVELRHVHVALVIDLEHGIVRVVDHAVHGDTAVVFHVGARGVEVDVVRHVIARLDHLREQQIFRHATLVGGDDVPVAGDAADGLLELEVVAASGVGLVARHDGGPLSVRHGRRTRVGEQVDRDQLGRNVEQVVAGLAQRRLSLLQRGEGDRLD